ncbi:MULTISPECIES: LacI family DNA-binding transcriptional regulator [Mammaliicoccus]|uniref:LacI family DNA-binding transcriptional regulator n=1 Tax=Mammaliicoccus TaxID=2803850 RepID=UPI0018848BCA|nr:LacI family DNA-binding transcriptional regulator [Mammaliicoccus lentus]MBF0841194.1 LacI family DNA-binding transcriptional regulator [Mammaliicoccus lentus]
MKKVTLHDVAKAANVSVATASWAINDKNKSRIPESTRIKVRETAEQLGYFPNALAKSLVDRKSKLIGFVTDDVATSPFAGEIIKGAQEEAWKNGSLLLIVNTEGKEDIEKQALDMLIEYQVKGVIYSTWYHHSITTPKLLERTDAVLVNCFDPQNNYISVIPNEFQGGKAATETLIKCKHHRIAFINTNKKSPAQEYRLKGYKKALENYSLKFDPSLVIYTDPTQKGGFKVTDEIIQSKATAVFCHNDRVAMGLYDGLKEKGISIPEDISIIGFDNQKIISENLYPELTSVALPHYELGVRGVRELLKLNDCVGEHPDSKSIYIDTPIIKRQSIKSL